MHSNRWQHSIVWRRTLLSLCFISGLPLLSVAQDSSYPAYPKRTSAAPDSMSRAEQQAELLVSLSADKIISLLNEEPGLLLEVKKTLVRKAYEQGRILNPEDLTDEALFRLINNDINIRVVVTQEIENRLYVRAKPTKEQLDRDRKMLQARGVSPNANAAVPEQKGVAAENQEDIFWTEHDRLLDSFPPAQNPIQAPGANPSPAPQPQTPALPYDSQRAIERTQLDYASPSMDSGGFGDFGGSMDGTGMQRINPDQLSGLMAARMASSGSSNEEVNSQGMGESAFGIMPVSAASQNGGAMGAGTFSSGLTSPFPSPSSSSLSDQLLYGSSQTLQQPNAAHQYPLTASLRMPRAPTGPSITDLGLDRPMLSRRPNPYADVPALYDLYTQYSSRAPILERFGAEIFRNGTSNFNMLPMDMPVGPDYVLGPGDSLTVSLWGGVSQRLIRVVDREGRISLPEAGVLQVSGRTLGDVQQSVQRALRSQFRDVQADVSISRIRSIRVYVVGNVEHPGPYDVSSLSTPLNALVEAGGPTSRGSLRTLKHC